MTGWKIVEVTDKFGPLMARIQKLMNRGCVGSWKGPFYIRDITLSRWLYLEFIKSSPIPLPEVQDPIPLQQLRFPPHPKSVQWKAPASPKPTSPKSKAPKQGTLEAWKREATAAKTAPTGTVLGGPVEMDFPSTTTTGRLRATQPAGAMTGAVLEGAKVRSLLSSPASPPTGQWFEDD